MTITVSAPATLAPTQHLRNLIEDVKYGAANAADLHSALMDVEMHLDIPLTEPMEPDTLA